MSKIVVITGASDGIGAETAVNLAGLGYTVVPIGRTQSKLDTVAARMKEAGQDSVSPIAADLQTLAAVRETSAQLLETYPRIDILINNAGVLEASKNITTDGFERTWAINHLAPFLMTLLLRERLEASGPARVITTSSTAANGGTIDEDIDAEFRGAGFKGMGTYCSSKLANALFSIELARRWDGTGNTSNHVHPGSVDTSWGRDTWWLNMGKPVGKLFGIFLTPQQGAVSLTHCASSDEGGTANGKFFNPKAKTMKARDKCYDLVTAGRLWTATEQAVGETWA